MTVRAILAQAALCVLTAVWCGSVHAQATYDYGALGAPKFVTTAYIDLGKITAISKYRSNAGHNYSDSSQFGIDGYKDSAFGNRLEACASMKHYFMNPDETTAVYAPVTGTVSRITGEQLGDQFEFVSDAQPAFRFILFHVVPDSPLAVGQRVEAGQRLGRHISTQTWSDIAVWVQTPRGKHLISYFEVMTDELFAQFQARGIASREQMILTRQYREANPVFSCAGTTTAQEAPAALVGLPAALTGAQYAVAAPMSNGENGNVSYMRLFNGGPTTGTSGTFYITVLGSPSGSSYGTALIQVPTQASVQYALPDILSRVGAPALVGGDTSYSLYMQYSGTTMGYQHVLYNATNGVFENLSNCKNALNVGTASKLLLNVHSSLIGAYPSAIQIHNTRNAAMNVALTLRDAATGELIRSTAEASRYTIAVGANATKIVSIAEIQSALGFTPTPSQYHFNIDLTDAAGGAADMIVAHTVRNQVFPADLNLTAACSMQP